MATGQIKTERLGEMKKSPLFFLRRIIHEYRDNKGDLHDEIRWESTDKDITASFTDNNWDDARLDFSLAVIDRFDEPEVNPDDKEQQLPASISIEFHAMDSKRESDWYWLIQNAINREANPIDKYWMRELLWVLNWRYIDSNALNHALQRFEQPVMLQVLGWISKLSKCLSQNKQAFLSSFLNAYHINYTVNPTKQLKEAFTSLGVANNPMLPQISEQYRNMFDWADAVCSALDFYGSFPDNGHFSNLWLEFIRWMKNETAFSDYTRLKQIVAMVSEPIRLRIIKRYFHDVRIGNTKFDTAIIEQFRSNDYSHFIRYRDCIQNPGNPIDLTIPLLADNILTLIRTNGEAFQTFDGMLDFVMQNSDVTNPSASFHLERFMPVCHGGAIYNRNDFTGFIDYSIVCEIDESKFSEDNLRKTIEELLSQSKAQKKYVCLSENRYLNEAYAFKCLDFHCEKIENHENTWWTLSDNSYYVNLFLEEKLYQTQDGKVQAVEFEDAKISTDVLSQSIRDFIGQYQQLGNGRFLIPSEKANTFVTRLISNYTNPVSMRIIPLNDTLIGLDFDVFGIWAELQKQLSPNESRNNDNPHYKQLREEYKQKEAAEVRKRVVNSLSNELGIAITNDSFFEIPYDRSRWNELRNRYYYKPTRRSEDSLNEFLCKQYIKQYPPFCAPQLGATRNEIIDFPYFWCRGIECFHNNLRNQTLETCKNWSDYSLYHFIEIIGFPKLKMTEAGYEPDKCIREFIGIANKAMQKFKRLKCKECGHLIFTDRNYSFNRYNYFACQNPSCKQYLKTVYLNFCHQCKKGLIDSRDSVRCPNGWYICPTCLSCCNDQQFERQAQRYVIERRPIPPRLQSMLGQGHNDKNQFFCYQCGVMLEEILVENEKKIVCPNCNKDFTEALR